MLYRNSNWSSEHASSSFHSLIHSFNNIQNLSSSHCIHPHSLRYSLFSTQRQKDPVKTYIQSQHRWAGTPVPLQLNISQFHISRTCPLYVPQTLRHISTSGHLHLLFPVPGTLFFSISTRHIIPLPPSGLCPSILSQRGLYRPLPPPPPFKIAAFP